MKLLQEFVELDEMSRVANMFELGACIWVDPSPNRNGHYFKLYDNLSPSRADRIARINYTEPRYEEHNTPGKEPWVLTSDEIKSLIEFLNDTAEEPYNNYTNWQVAVYLWNYEYFSQKGIPIKLSKFFAGDYDKIIQDKNFMASTIEIPDYTKLLQLNNEDKKKK